jgi:transposase
MMTNGVLIPNDLVACQALIAELTQRLAAQQRAVEDQQAAVKNHELTIGTQHQSLRVHELTIQNHELTIRTHELTITSLSEQIAARDQEIVEQKLLIADLLRRAFEKRSERYIEDPNQLRLDFPHTPEAADAVESLAEALEEVARADEIVIPEHTRRKHRERKPRDEQLPEHLPRYEVEAPVPDAAKTCPTHGAKKLIGHDRLETLEFERPKLKVRVTLIPKYACENSPECGVTEAARPAGLVEGNRYDTSVAAEIIADKFGYHLPIYRQQDLFASSGWTPNRSTLLHIAEAAGELLPPFIDYLRGEVLTSGVIGTDDTCVTLLLPAVDPKVNADDPKSRRMAEVFAAARAEKKPSVTARMWAYRSVLVPLNVFDFTVSHHRDGPDQFLIDSQFTGTLLADCYSGYQGITLHSDARIIRAACNAHARRKFFEARDNHPLLASQFLALYQQLYDVEDRARTFSAVERQALREADARPIWNRIRDLLDSDAAKQVLPKDKIAEALNYLRNHWDALIHSLTDGRVPIDNNDTEQLMKQVAIGRKNWLFIGSVSAGERAANFLTLVSSAVRNDLDVAAYLKAVLDALLSGSTDYASLRPDQWAVARPEAIRAYRQEERRDRYARKSARRAERRLPICDTS